MDGSRKAKQTFISQSAGVRARERPRYRGWKYVWTGIKKGRIKNWRKISQKINKLRQKLLRKRKSTSD
jgi:hypothetical protein